MFRASQTMLALQGPLRIFQASASRTSMEVDIFASVVYWARLAMLLTALVICLPLTPLYRLSHSPFRILSLPPPSDPLLPVKNADINKTLCSSCITGIWTASSGNASQRPQDPSQPSRRPHRHSGQNVTLDSLHGEVGREPDAQNLTK